MEILYYIVEDGESKRVVYEVYEKYEGKKYRKFPNEGVRFVQDLLRGYW